MQDGFESGDRDANGQVTLSTGGHETKLKLLS
jgi:hypothetical protein